MDENTLPESHLVAFTWRDMCGGWAAYEVAEGPGEQAGVDAWTPAELVEQIAERWPPALPIIAVGADVAAALIEWGVPAWRVTVRTR